MNKLIRLGLIFVTSVALVLSGCVQQNQASAPELEKPKEQELTVSEVLQKSANVMSKGGYAYDIKWDLSVVFTMQGDVEKITSMGYDGDWEETGQPPAEHIKGNMINDNLNLPVEGYYIGDESYKHIAGTGWTKKQGVEMRPGGKDQRMSDGLAMMAKLFRGSSPNGVTMKKEANTYVLKFDLQVLKANKSYESYIKKQIESELDLAQDEHPNGAKLKKEQIQFHTFKDTYRINASTFRFLGGELDYEASVPPPDGTVLKVEDHSECNLKGDLNDKIEVPADVKSQAEMEE